MNDFYSSYSSLLTSPLRGGFSIVPSDTTDLPYVTRELYAAGGGKINAVWEDGNTFAASLASGERVAWRIVRVLSAGTTATGLEGFY